MTSAVITPAQLLEHWQGHRKLTRRLIEAYPDKELFTFSIGGMRSFAELVKELLSIAVPGLRQMTTGAQEALQEHADYGDTKEKLLKHWDESTAEIDRLWASIPETKFQENTITFGQYEGTVWSSIFYFIDNEIHHRGQAYVYMRALGLEPPYFWER